jgi:hypothetical protein
LSLSIASGIATTLATIGANPALDEEASAEATVFLTEVEGAISEGYAEALSYGSEVGPKLQEIELEAMDVVGGIRQRIADALASGGRRALGRFFSTDLKGSTERIIGKVLNLAKQYTGGRVQVNPQTGLGRILDFKYIRSGISNWIEVKYRLPTAGDVISRVTQQLTQAAGRAGINDRVILFVYKPYTQQEVARFLSKLPPQIASGVTVVSNPVELYKIVTGG